MLYAIAAVLLALSIYPVTLYPLSLRLLRRFARRPLARGAVATPPSISIVFCAANEEAVIADKLANCAALIAAYPGRAEALVYCDGCRDRTVEIAEAFVADAAAPIRVFHSAERLGKSHGMNRLIAAASGEIIVLTDANVTVAEDALTVAAGYFSDPAIGCICGHLIYTNPDEGDTAAVGAGYWRFEEHLKQMESDLGSTVGADGGLFAIRKALHRPTPLDIIDDMHSSLSTLIAGARMVQAEEFRAFERTATTTADEFRRKVRIACRCFNCYRRLAPELHRLGWLDIYKFYGHKVLRWLAMFFFVAAVAVFALALARDGAWGVLAAFAGLAALSGLAWRLGVPPFPKLGQVFLAFVAAALGVVDSLRGKRYQTWAAPASSRAPAPTPGGGGG